MPKTTVKKTSAKTDKQSFLQKLNPNSPKKKFLLFIAIFLVIGGGVMAYRSFADPVGIYWPQQIRQATGSPWIQWTKDGVKKDTIVWFMNGKDGVRVLDEWQPIIWAKNVRVCATVFNRERANPVPVDIFPTFNGAVKSKTQISVSGTGAYQKICSLYVQHTDPNARIGGTVVNMGSGSGNQLQLGSISIEN